MQNLYINTKLRTLAPLLGSTSGNPNLQSEFVQARLMKSAEDDASAPLRAKEELACIQTIRPQTAEQPTTEELAEVVEKTSTVFFSDKRGLFLFDYQLN